MNIVALFIIFASLVTIFVATYVMNNKTKAPDIEVDMDGCKGCHNFACGHHQTHKLKEEK